MFNVSIPRISDEEMQKRYKHIKPVITKNGKLHYFREFSLEEIRDISCLWNIDEYVQKEVNENELEIFEGKDFICLHRYGHYGLYTPSIGEILSQINTPDIPLTTAFEIIESPKTPADFNKSSFSSIAFHNGYYVSTIRLYRKIQNRCSI